MDLQKIYNRSPVVLQNVMTAAFGARERLLRYGGRYRAFAQQLNESQWWPAERLHLDQQIRLQRMVRFAASRVPYYRDLFRELGIAPDDIASVADLAALPLLEKETVRAQPELFVPDAPKERLILQMTGGTTGTPLRYYVSPAAIQFNYAAYEVRFRNWAGVHFGERMASINGRPIVPMHQSAGPLWRYNPAFNQLYLSAYHLSDEHLPRYIERLRRFRPVVIVAYVSTVHALARYMIAHGLQRVVQPRAVMVSSETLFDWIRADLESAFGCKVYNGYGLGELSALITECEAGTMHVSTDYGVTEIVNIDGQDELVCTGLFNYAMPLLRYRTGDVVKPVKAFACACRRELPAMGEILGRVDDRVLTPEGVAVGAAPLSLAFQSVPHVRASQIHQASQQEVDVWIEVTAAFSEAEERLLLREMRQRLGSTIGIRLVRVSAIPRTAGGKQRLIVSRLRRDGGAVRTQTDPASVTCAS